MNSLSMGTVYSIATNDEGTARYAGGTFSLQNGYRYVAACDESNCWSPLGDLNANEDIQAIIPLVDKIHRLGEKGRRPQVRISLATFVPKPHTPFQWLPMAPESLLSARIRALQWPAEQRRKQTYIQNTRQQRHCASYDLRDAVGALGHDLA